MASGNSMSPAINNGDRLWVCKLPRLLMKHFIKRGRVVVVEAEPDYFIVKRIHAIKEGQIMVMSDNADTQSRYCGTLLPLERVKGVVLFAGDFLRRGIKVNEAEQLNP